MHLHVKGGIDILQLQDILAAHDGGDIGAEIIAPGNLFVVDAIGLDNDVLVRNSGLSIVIGRRLHAGRLEQGLSGMSPSGARAK